MKLDFWDVVRVSDTCRHVEVRGKLGFIKGIGEEEGNPHRSIAIWFYDSDRLWCVPEEDLIAQGRKDDMACAEYEAWTRVAPHLRVSSDGQILDE